MKNILMCCIILFICCNKKPIKNKKNDTVTKNKIISEQKLKIDSIEQIKTEQLIKGFEICESVDYYKSPFEEIMITGDLKLKKEFKNKFCYGSKEKDVKKLFFASKIKCIVYKISKEFRLFEINYDSKEFSSKVFSTIKKINDYDDNIYKYHDFFKRGLVFILEEEKIIMVTFNPFYDNSLDDKLKKHFSEHKEKYDKVLISIGMSSIEELIQ